MCFTLSRRPLQDSWPAASAILFGLVKVGSPQSPGCLQLAVNICLPCIPVILVKGASDGYHWIIQDKGYVQVSQLVRCDDPPDTIRRLEVKPEELRGSHIHASGNLASIVGLPNCILQQFPRLLSVNLLSERFL